jgi:hypothetical protein
LNAPRKVTCHHCENRGCEHCELERRAAAGGEQGLTAVDLELEQLRRERDAWHRRCLKAEALLEEARQDRDEAQQAAAYAQRDRDAALAQLALLAKGGAA